MNDLNYHHLYYFWVVVREGGISAARDKLHVTQPTISVQLAALEEALGQPLFDRRGRRLVLTEVGEVVYRYASDIFALGRELVSSLERGVAGSAVRRLTVGVADVLPKLVASELLVPVLRSEASFRVVCFEGKPADLLARLALHEIDLVLSDHAVGPESSIRAYNHQLGKSGVTLVASGGLAERYRQGFPQSLDGAPFLLPTANTALRRSLDQWMEKMSVHPEVVAEFEDSALLKAFSARVPAVLPVSTVVVESVVDQYNVEIVGVAETVTEAFYAISVERKLRHPAIVAVVESARERLA